MRITVRIKDVKIVADDKDNNSVIKWDSHSKCVQETIKVMSNECIKLYKEIKQ